MWSMPLMPYMSPAAIGCKVVISRGWPVAAKRAPMAASTASGQPRPLDEETDTVMPSPIRPAASSAETTFAILNSQARIDLDHAAGLGRFLRRHAGRQRPHAILARRRRRSFAAHRRMEGAQGADI